MNLNTKGLNISSLNLLSFILRHNDPKLFIFHTISSNSKSRCNYDILGISPKATTAEIKNAYYEKSKKYHPDVNKDSDAEKKFQELNEAYEILSNENSRTDYDIQRGFKQAPQPSPIIPYHRARPRQADFDNQALYTRNVFHRMKQREFERAKAQARDFKEHFTQDQQKYENFADKQAREEQEFYDSLDEDLKRKYEDYYVRQKQQERNKQQEKVKAEEKRASQNGGMIFLTALTLFCFMLITISDIPQTRFDNPHKVSLRPKKEKND